MTDEKLAAGERGIAALPHDLRTPPVLSALEERSHQECAELLNISPKAVEMPIYRACKQLTAWLTKARF